MFVFLLFAFQASAAEPADISIHATVDAQEVRVESSGGSGARAWAEPDGGSTAHSSGDRRSSRFELRIDARIADLPASGGADPPQATETEEPR